MTVSIETVSKALAQAPMVAGAVPGRIGYVVNYSFHIWYKVVMNFMQARAGQYGVAEVLIRDAELSLDTELARMDELIATRVDVLIVTPAATEGAEAITAKAAAAGIPLVLEANPVPAMTTMVAICDYDAGVRAGRWAGQYALDNLGGKAHILDIAYPPLRPCLLRSEGFFDGVKEVIPSAVLTARVNGEAMVDKSSNLAGEVLDRSPEVNIIFGMDDESIHGGVQAAQARGRTADDIVLVGFGMAGDVDKDMLMADGPWKASVAMFPEWVGLRCVDQAIKVFNGQAVPPHDVSPTAVVTSGNVTDYFTKTGEGWVPNLKTVAAIIPEKQCTKV